MQDSLTDPRRTIPAGTANGLVHRVYKGKARTFFSACGIAISDSDLLLLLQRPEDITCPACADSKVTKEEVAALLKSQPKLLMIRAPAPDDCQVCATKHEPGEPHNKQSLFYQMKFHQDYGRWPTWEDAMKHCSEDTKREWRIQLRCAGENLD